jgi:hypothetical protein
VRQKRRYYRVAENIGQDLTLRETAVVRAQTFARNDARNHFILVVAVHDRKSFPEADALTMPAENAIADGMEGSTPNALRPLWEQ